MKDPRDIILRPLLTEKAVGLRETENKYCFEVSRGANKIEIKSAVEELFKVKVLSVRVLNSRGKKRRMGRFEGKRPDWRKAICKLREGDSIEVFEGT
ncbi:MAG: 50S ribosomal protein L23 [bacterium]